ncbi:MAG: hypothetical protein EPO24_07815 [Bacteroidetes bacterium]|nr:MAG: hypothetical protein EPO24_07815 [Bacteroidota bacterium]
MAYNENFLWGKPELKFVVWHGETEKGTFTFDSDAFSGFVPDFTPIGLRHVLQDNTIDKRLDGYRFTGEVTFGTIAGNELNSLAKLFTSLNAGNNYYDRLQFYPSYNDMPGWWFDVYLSDEVITTAFMALIAHRDIELRFESKSLLDHVPLAESAFLTWGNMQLTFQELDMAFSTLS